MSAPSDRLAAALADRYRIERELGAGGMATVFLAEDVRHRRKVALKVLKPELAAVLGAERFVQEITMTAALQHPHILPLFDSGEADGFLYYVMPFIQGETLREKLNRDRQLGVDEAVRITIEVADALEYAHGNGVIHRDIKPENILLANGRPMVADFGIALAVSAAAGGRMTETGLSLGTPHYMSPEQATADREITGRSDTYSLASVLYEMLAGVPPHEGGTAQQTIMRIIADTPRPVTDFRKSVPPNVAAAVAKALEKLPADRFESARDFAQALGNPAFATNVAPAGTAGQAPTDWQARAFLPVAAVAVIAMIIAAWGWMRPAPTRPVARYHLGLPDSAQVAGTFARIAATRDGSRLVYRGGSGEESTYPLWVRERNQLGATKLAGTEGARAPFISPDGEQVAYFGTRTLWTIPLRGGPPTMITAGGVGEYGGSWSTDGVLYVDGAGPSGLMKVPALPRSQVEPFTRLDSARGEINHVFPEVLPNGRGVVFVVVQNTYETWEIAVADIETGAHRILGHGVYARYAGSGHLLIVNAAGILTAARFDQRAMRLIGTPVPLGETVMLRGTVRTPDLVVSDLGTIVYTHGGGLGGAGGFRGEPVWVNREGRAEPVSPGWTNAARFPALSPDGNQLALSIYDTDGTTQHVWVRQLARGTTTKITHDGAINWRPSWHRNSRSLLFLSDRKKQGGELFVRRSDASDSIALVFTRRDEISEASVTRDSQFLVYRQGANLISDLYARRLTGDTTPIVLAATEFQERGPEVSPDGRYLAYSSDETGRHEVYVRPFPNVNDGKWIVSTSGGMNPLWSREGKELFYRNGEGDLVAVEVVTNGTSPIGRQRSLFATQPYVFESTHRSYDVNPDGRRFVMIRRASSIESMTAPLVVVENFFEELRRKVPR